MKRFLLFIIAVAALVILGYFIYTYNEKALFWSVDNNNFKAFSSLIEKDRSLINLKNGNGTPLLIHCLKNGRDTMALHLLRRNADANQKDSEGRNALFYPTSKATLKFILNQGVDVNEKDLSGLTPLHFIDSIEILDVFIRSTMGKLEINARNKNNVTPLMWEIIEGENVDKIRILLNYGASIYCEDSSGLNCLDHAKDSDNPEIREFIEKEDKDNSIKITKIFGMPFNLTGSSISTRNSMAINNFYIREKCDELLVIGYGGQRMPGEYSKILDGLEELFVPIYGKKARIAYKAIKELSDVFSTGSVRVDFFITSESNGVKLKNDPYAIIDEPLIEKNNTPGFKDFISPEDGFSPKEVLCAVVKNKHTLQEVDFCLEIYSVVHSKKRGCTENTVSGPVSPTPDQENSINIDLGSETNATPTEGTTILTQKKII